MQIKRKENHEEKINIKKTKAADNLYRTNGAKEKGEDRTETKPRTKSVMSGGKSLLANAPGVHKQSLPAALLCSVQHEGQGLLYPTSLSGHAAGGKGQGLYPAAVRVWTSVGQLASPEICCLCSLQGKPVSRLQPVLFSAVPWQLLSCPCWSCPQPR